MRENTYQPATGFTIIETLIVLAIAGLILMLVFLAIPVLTRNGRNNQRQQDVATILSAVSQWELANSGNMPPDCGNISIPLQTTCDSTTPSPGNFLQYIKSKLTFYDPQLQPPTGGIIFASSSPLASAIPSSNTNLDLVYISNYQKCDVNTPGSTTSTAAGFFDVVAIYAIEAAGGISPQCHQL